MVVLTQHDSVRNKIREEILTMHLLPGMRLRVKDFQEPLRVGAMPIRDALIQLQSEGLVTIMPQSGTFVSYLSYERLKQSVFVCQKLDEAILTELASQPDKLLVDQINQAIALASFYGKSADIPNFSQQVLEFWQLLYQSVGKSEAWGWRQSIWERVFWLQVTNFGESDHLTQVVKAQSELFDALVAGDQIEVDKISRRQRDKIYNELSYYHHVYPEFFDGAYDGTYLKAE